MYAKKRLIPVIIFLALSAIAVSHLVFNELADKPLPLVERAWTIPVSDTTSTDDIPFRSASGISPDGMYIYSLIGYQSNVETGELKIKIPLWYDDYVITPDGRYIYGIVNGKVQPPYDMVINTFDEKDKKPPVFITDFSPSGTRGTTYYFLDNLTLIPENVPAPNWPREIDFTKIKHTGGSTNLLWDIDEDIPIAQIYACGAGCNQPTSNGDILLTSINVNSAHLNTYGQYYKKVYHISSPNFLVDSLFSPNGKYILFVIWERSKDPLTDKLSSPENVIDSVFVLVDWRTGASRELIRISQIDRESVAVTPLFNTLWSSDGKTIVASRVSGSPLIIRLNHP